MVKLLNRRRLLAGLGATLLAPLVRAAGEGQAGHAGHAGHDASPARAPRPELNASLVVDPQGRFCAVRKHGESVVFQRCDGPGLPWSAPVPVSPAGERVAAGGDLRPKLAIGPDGVLHVTWTRPLAKPYTGEIRHTRSLDGGATFQPAQTVHADRQEITHRFDALTVTSQGKLVIAWIDKREQQRALAAGEPYVGAAVYFAVSDDNGASFRGDYRLAEHSCECCRIALQPLPDGSVIALWRHVFERNLRDHAMARLLPDGRSEPLERATFDGWRVDACPHHGPSLALGADGTRHAVWFANGELSYGQLGGAKVRAAWPIRAAAGAAAEHADLACRGERLVIAAQAFDGSAMTLLRWTSHDAGASWQALAPVAAAGATGHPFAVLRDGRFFVLWPNRDEPLRLVEVA